MSPAAGGSEGSIEIQGLLALLRHERLPLGVEETLRLVHLLSLADGLRRVEMEELVACVVARTSEEREACHRALALWFERESARLEQALEAPSEPADGPAEPCADPVPAPRPALPVRVVAPVAPVALEQPHAAVPPPAPSAPEDWRFNLAAAAACVGSLVLGAIAPAQSGGRSPAQAIALTAFAGVVSAVLIRAGRRRSAVLPPSFAADLEVAPDLPPPPLVLRSPALLDARTRDHLVEGVGSYATEHLTRALDPVRTIQATVKMAGLPRLRFRDARESRTVWLWVDDTSRDALMDRAVREIHQTLSCEGIRTDVVLYRALPALTGLRALPLTRDGFARGPYRRLPSDEIDNQRSNGIVAVLTDGRELSLAADGARSRQAHRALAALRGFSRLAVVDFGRGQSRLADLAEEHDLDVIQPEQLARFLSGVSERAENSAVSAPLLDPPLMTWAAVCSIAPRPVDEGSAHKLRERLGLKATPWAVGILTGASEAGGAVWLSKGERAKLVHWLWSSDVDGLRDEGPFRSALQFWRERFKGNPVDEALLRLWDKPDAASAAADVLWDWSETPLGARIRLELGDRAPLPEEEAVLRDPRGKLVLPWRLSELAPEARWRLRELGLGYVEKAAAEERLRFPGTAALAIGWSAGIGVGALLSLTGSLVGALGGGAALAIAVYGVVRRFALLGSGGAAVEESESEPEVEAPEPEEAPEESKPEPEDIVAEPSETPDDIIHEAPPPSVPVLDQRVSLLEMVEIRDGTFLMGSRDDDPRAYNSEKPQHQVEVGAFLLGKYVVTQAEYEAVTGTNPSPHKGPRKPVTGVSWVDAAKFCNLLSTREGVAPAYEIEGDEVNWNEGADGYRLPTEAEWEYAARAGAHTHTAWSFGDNESMIGAYAWFRENSDGQPHPVGEKLPNRWGLFDMHGNVWEWCWDEFRSYSEASRSGGDRVLRGGSFLLDPWHLRSANRDGHEPERRNRGIGFRCARGSRRPS